MSKPKITAESAFSEAYDWGKQFGNGADKDQKSFSHYLNEKYDLSPLGSTLLRILGERNTFVAYDLIVEKLEDTPNED